MREFKSMKQIFTFCSLLLLTSCSKPHKNFVPLDPSGASQQHRDLEIPPHLVIENMENTDNKAKLQKQVTSPTKSLHIHTVTNEIEDIKKEKLHEKKMKTLDEIEKNVAETGPKKPFKVQIDQNSSKSRTAQDEILDKATNNKRLPSEKM